jgi:hypothetical protein
MKLVSITHASNGKNKYTAIFETNGRRKTVHFGAHGMDDYTITHDKDQRERYLQRHSKDLETKDPSRAGYLSYYILWGSSTNLHENIANYKRKFHL